MIGLARQRVGARRPPYSGVRHLLVKGASPAVTYSSPLPRPDDGASARPENPRRRAEEELTVLRAVVADNPDDAEAHRRLSMACTFYGRRKEARREASAALALEPNEPRSHTVLGMALHERDRFAAQQAYRRALRLDPRQIEAELNLSLVQARSLRLPTAIGGAARVLHRDPSEPWAWWTLDRLLVLLCGQVYGGAAVVWILCMLAVTQSPQAPYPAPEPVVAALLAVAVAVYPLLSLRSLHRMLPCRKILTFFARRDPLIVVFAVCGPPAWLATVVGYAVGGRTAAVLVLGSAVPLAIGIVAYFLRYFRALRAAKLGARSSVNVRPRGLRPGPRPGRRPSARGGGSARRD